MNLETVRRIDSISQLMAKMDDIADLYGPLAQHLLPLRRQMDIDGLPDNERWVQLAASDWEKQHKAGVSECVGIEIRWKQ